MKKNIHLITSFLVVTIISVVSLSSCEIFNSDSIDLNESSLSSSCENSNSDSTDLNESSLSTSISHLSDNTSSVEENIYFFPQSIAYDGPRLNMDYVGETAYVWQQGNYVGTGAAFEVTLNRCVDGDTTVFYYPYEIYNLFPSTTTSTRYFNMDTPETYDGAEEEWGKLASNYNCCMLDIASSILIQTDPGDNLFDRYNRLLGWIWIKVPGDNDYQLLNYWMVRQGLANVKYLYGGGETAVTSYQGMTYTEWMWVAEAGAEMDEFGIHSNLLDYYWDYDNNRPNWNRWNESGCNW
jgi:endonuclease YncB( thermonuclease family)